MNLVNELENELVFALLIEKNTVEKINSASALELINKIKSVLEQNSVEEKERKTKLSAGKSSPFFSH